MPFPKKIKEEVLVASARYCCVCRRYKGLKVQIHHIISEKEGGPDTFDNAILLCLDCHTDSGHYNPEHPMGTKFSPEELRKQRDSWYEIVKNNGISVYEEEELVHCRYYIAREPRIIKKITRGHISRFPVKNILIHDNEILKFQKRIMGGFLDEHTIFYDADEGAEKKYLSEYPDTKKVSKRDSPFYSYTRIPNLKEVVKTCGNMRACKFLLSTGEDISNIFKLLAFIEPCDDTFYEKLYIRPIWTCYLCITNVSDKLLEISSINYNGILEDNLWNVFDFLKSAPEGEIILPEIKIEANSSVVIPILTLLAPFEDVAEELSLSGEEFEDIEVVETSHSKIRDLKESSKFNILGPCILPNKINLKYNSSDITEDIHEFDFSNMYICNSYFMCGCCPHVFLRKANNLEYYCEVFNKKPNKLQTFEIVIPKNVKTFILAELEYEKTYIKDFKINGKIIISNRFLNKDECVELAVKEGDVVEGVGFYSLKKNCINKSSPMFKNNLIKRYMDRDCKSYQTS